MKTGLLEKPLDYYRGLTLEDRIITRNVVFFERHSEEKLKKKSLRSRLHHRYVLVRVVRTPGTINIDGFNFDLDEGEIILISPFQFHHYSHLKARSLLWQFITFELNQGADRIRRMNFPVQKPDRVSDRLWEDFIGRWETQKEETRLECLPILDRLLMRFCFAGTQQSVQRQLTREESPWVPLAESLIIQSIRQGWNLDEVARKLNISDRQFRSRFKSALDISPKEYRMRYQLHSAISLMQNQQLNLASIAELSGFNTQPAFTRFIKRLTGISPKYLRDRVLKGNPLPDTGTQRLRA